MKRKSTLRKVEPPNLVLEPTDPADPVLPKPKNSIANQASENASSYASVRYQMTKRIGGLVPDGHGKAYWRCTNCNKIRETYPMARECCHASAAQVLICTLCFNRDNSLYRIGECQCPTKK
jgi:hypothetical protein